MCNKLYNDRDISQACKTPKTFHVSPWLDKEQFPYYLIVQHFRLTLRELRIVNGHLNTALVQNVDMLV